MSTDFGGSSLVEVANAFGREKVWTESSEFNESCVGTDVRSLLPKTLSRKVPCRLHRFDRLLESHGLKFPSPRYHQSSSTVPKSSVLVAM